MDNAYPHVLTKSGVIIPEKVYTNEMLEEIAFRGEGLEKNGSSPEFDPPGISSMCSQERSSSTSTYVTHTGSEELGTEATTEGSFGFEVHRTRAKDANLKKRMERAVMTILDCLGEDVEREGLLETPERVTKALFFLTKGYGESASDLIGNALFTSGSTDMVMVKNITFSSMCEHHMLPFHGKAHIAMLPNGRVLGLSKYARLVDMYARRLQIQEQLTAQVADAIMLHVKPKGVAVVIQAEHMCMIARGVQKHGAETVTSCFRGNLGNDYKRHEFLTLLTS